MNRDDVLFYLFACCVGRPSSCAAIWAPIWPRIWQARRFDFMDAKAERGFAANLICSKGRRRPLVCGRGMGQRAERAARPL